MSDTSIFEHDAKLEAVFAALCKYCGHRWGNHAILGCQHEDCKNDKEEGCKSNGIIAVRSMMKDPHFKYTFVPPIPKEKETVQAKLQ